MKHLSLLPILLIGACTMPTQVEPSLAPRPAEAIDPRLPVAGTEAPGPVDPALALRLRELVASVQDGQRAFDDRAAEAGRLSAAAGPMASESWIAAEQALSRLVEQYGVTTRAAADVDALAADLLERQRWIGVTNRDAIAAAGAEIRVISDRQSDTIDRIRNQLSR